MKTPKVKPPLKFSKAHRNRYHPSKTIRVKRYEFTLLTTALHRTWGAIREVCPGQADTIFRRLELIHRAVLTQAGVHRAEPYVTREWLTSDSIDAAKAAIRRAQLRGGGGVRHRFGN